LERKVSENKLKILHFIKEEKKPFYLYSSDFFFDLVLPFQKHIYLYFSNRNFSGSLGERENYSLKFLCNFFARKIILSKIKK